MFRPLKVGLATLCATLVAAPSLADSVRCHIIYGGENFESIAEPTDSPYQVAGQKIGRYFEFKITYVREPLEIAAISIYVYAIASGESVLIHEAKYPRDAGNGTAPHGFTGFNYIYEPSKSSELQYWCERR